MGIRFERLKEGHVAALQAWSTFDINPWLNNQVKELVELQKKSSNRHCFVAFGENPIGVIDLEINNDKTAWMSLVVRPDSRGQGLGTVILQAFLHEPVVENIHELKVEIEIDNIASIRCFKKAGFIEREDPETTEGFVLLAKKLS